MKTKAILFFIFLCISIKVFSLNGEKNVLAKKTINTSLKRIINSSDSIIFNLTNATLTATYIDLPLIIKSNDAIFSFNYAFTFNLSKLTYSTTVNVLSYISSFQQSAYFNTNDFHLRGTASSQQALPSSGDTTILVIRLALSAPCVSLSTADFGNVLTILNGTQCSYLVKNLNFNQYIPVADFSTGPTCLNSLVLFSDSSKIGSGQINSWSWNFSNGVNSQLQNNVITYSVIGTSSSTLIVSATNGCSDTVIKPITISQPPVSSFSYSYDCAKDTIYFINTSTVSAGSIIGSQWYFGDLSPLDFSQNPIHHYVLSGFYNVLLTSTASSLCTSTIEVTVSLRPGDINRDNLIDVNDFVILVPALGTNCD